MVGVIIISMGVIGSFVLFGFWGGFIALSALLVICNMGR